MSIFSDDRLHFWNDAIDATRAVRRIAYVGDEIYPNGVYLTVGATRPAAIWNRLGICAGGDADNETFIDPRIVQEHFKALPNFYDMDIVSVHSDALGYSMLFTVLERSSNYITIAIVGEGNIERPHADSQQLGVGWMSTKNGVDWLNVQALEDDLNDAPHIRKLNSSIMSMKFTAQAYHIGIAAQMYANYWRMPLQDMPMMSIRPSWRNTIQKLQNGQSWY